MKWLISVPFSVHVTVEAENLTDITEDMVDNAMLEQHGKYATVDIRHGGDFEILGEA